MVDRELPVPVLLDVGHQLASTGNWEGARVSFQHAVYQLQQRSNLSERASIDGYELAAALQHLGNCNARLGLHQESAKHFERSLELKRDYYNLDTCGAGSCCYKNLDLAGALERLGNARMECAQYEASQRHFNEALDMKRLVYGKKQHEEQQQQQQSHSHQRGSTGGEERRSPTSAVVELKQQAYGYDRAQNADVAYTLTKLGQLAAVSGHYHAARKKYTQALEMLRQNSHLDDHVDIAKVLGLLGHVNAVSGKPEYAKAYFDQAVNILEALMARPGGGERRYAEVLEKICSSRDACLPQQEPPNPKEDSLTFSSSSNSEA